MFPTTKEKVVWHAISFAQTFLATFLITIAGIVTTIPHETLSNPQVWSGSAVAAVLVSAVRSAVKVAWEQIVVPLIQSKISFRL